MATLYPIQFPATPDGTYPGTYNPQGSRTASRHLKFAEWLYEFTGSEVALDVIQLGLGSSNAKFPKGTEVFPQLSYFYVETDCAATLTCDCGDLDASAASYAHPNGDAYSVAHVASDADRYADGVDCGAVGVDVFASGVAAAVPFVLQSDSYLTVTLATLVTPAANGKLRTRIAYFSAD